MSSVAARALEGGPLIDVNSPLGVAFGGGGVRGWAHVGVLSVIQQHGLRAGQVAGTSAGAITASFMAAGFSVTEMMEVMRSHRTRAMFSLRLDGQGLLGAEAFSEYLSGYFEDRRIEDLEIPLAIICTDLETGKEVVIDRGPVVPAVMASCALPGIFAPVEVDGRLLVDGGISNNVPVSALVNRGARYTIGVQLFKRIGTLMPAGDGTLDEPDDGLEERVGLGMWVDRIKQRFGREAGLVVPPNGLEVVQRALDIMMSQLEGYRLQAYHPDILIVPRVRSMGMLSLGMEKEAIFQAGREAAMESDAEMAALAVRLRMESKGPGASAG